MSFKFPGGEWLGPAEVGFNAAIIGAAGNLNGPIIPWVAARKISRLAIIGKETGASSVTLRVFEVFDFDGVTALLAVGAFGLWNTFTTGMVSLSAGNPSLASVTPGTVPATAGAFIFGAPYIQFNVLNNDAVNAATVTIRMGLFE